MIAYCFFSACGFLDLRLFAVHLALCVLCCDWCFCFSLCERIFLCCLRSFALARATSPCQSQRAGPQRFLVWVRVCGCCALEICQVMTAKVMRLTNKTQSPICADTWLFHSTIIRRRLAAPYREKTVRTPHSIAICGLLTKSVRFLAFFSLHVISHFYCISRTFMLK